MSGDQKAISSSIRAPAFSKPRLAISKIVLEGTEKLQDESPRVKNVKSFPAAESILFAISHVELEKRAATSDSGLSSDAEMVDIASLNFGYQKHQVVSPSQSSTTSRQSPSISNCPPSGKLLLCGRRQEMEDTVTIAPSFIQLHHGPLESYLRKASVESRPSCDLHFFAVYDGHGGSQASRYCMNRLHHALAEELSSLLVASEGLEEPLEGPISFSTWKKAMVLCFSKIDEEVGGVCPDGQCDRNLDRAVETCRGDSIAPENVGTTAVVAVVNSWEIVVANCGDSRAVLSRGGKVVPLSRDHKPDRHDEANRIDAAGGRVVYWDGYRVGGLLAVSRSIGDCYLKQYVVSEPEVTSLVRTKEDECLILASDGLWDVVSNDTACEIARRCLDSSRQKRAVENFLAEEDPASTAAAAMLVKLAYSRGSKDNISVVVIDLKV